MSAAEFVAAPAPEMLDVAGRALWATVAGKYQLRADEMATLEDACRVTDMVESLTEVWTDLGRPTITKGSMGQEVIHPLIGEIRTQRMARNALFRQLKLPDEPAGDAVKPNQHRAAAQTKWSQRPSNGA